MSYHDDDGFGFDSFGTGSIAESVGGLGVVGLGRRHAGYLHTTHIYIYLGCGVAQTV